MSEVVVHQLVNGQLVENCYLVGDPATREAVLIDPGEESDRFLALAADGDWQIRAIWLTHAHIDHVLGVAAVKAATGAPIYLHPADRALYDRAPLQAAWMGIRSDPLPPPDRPLAAGDRLPIGSCAFEVRHTPGHSPGSVSFVGAERVFVGDVLFAGSVGRTDLPGGDWPTLQASILRELLSLPDSTIVHAGHGPDTSIGVERRTNPFLAMLRTG